MQQSAATRQRGPWAQLPLSGITGRRAPTLFDSLFPRATTVHRLAAAIAMAGILALLAQARFYLPDNPVPITFHTFGVLVTGGVLGLRWGVLSALVYYLAGMAGLPVFQGGGNGWQYVAHGTTGGYLLGFILATAFTGFMAERGWNRSASLWPMTLASLVLYIPALTWLAVFDFGWPAEGQLFSSGMYPFIPGDVIKLLLAAFSVGALWKISDSRQEAAGREQRSNTER